jgi:uncharacterized membrane protein YccC
MDLYNLIAAVIGAMAAIVAAIFAYPAWRDSRRRAKLG